jgi:transcriptional regulator with XRE-family HTH domain
VCGIARMMIKTPRFDSTRACSHFQATTMGADSFEIRSARSEQRMSSWDGQQPDQESGLSLRVGKDEGNDLAGLGNVPCTIREVARLAGVSIATVSRLTSGSSNVSCKTAAKVSAAISQLQYRPNALAAELARGKGGSRRMRSARRPTIAGTQATQPSYSGALARDRRSQTGRVSMLENEY